MDDEIKLICDPNFSIINVQYSIDRILSVIKDKCDNNEIDSVKKIILDQHDIIFNYDNMVNNNRILIQELFMDNKFISLFTDICGLINFSEQETIFINKIIYDFFEMYTIDTHNDIKESLLSISYIVNNTLITKLAPIAGINVSRILAIISYSSFKLEKVVHRINEFIINRLTDIEYHDLKNIYNIIFDLSVHDGKKLKGLFIYSMLETPDTQIVDKRYINAFNNISKLMIDILIDINFEVPHVYTSTNFLDLMKEYASTIVILNIPHDNLRFKIKDTLGQKIKFNVDFDKYECIYTILKSLEIENVIVP